MSLQHFARNIYSGHAAKTAPTQPDSYTFDKAPLIYGTTCALWTLALLVICMRMYSRRILTKYHGIDDYIMLVAMMFSTANLAIVILLCNNGLGKHTSEVTMNQFTIFAKVVYGFSIIYPYSLGLVKISILTFYRRIFPSDTFRHVCLGMICFVTMMMLAISLASAFACVPPSQIYRLQVDAQASCINKSALQYATGSLNVATDIFILLMPMRYLFLLTVDAYRRIGVIVLFSLGLISCVASACRLSKIYQFYHTDDPTYDAYPVAIWSAVEIDLTIVTASMAASKPFFEKFILSHLKKQISEKLTTPISSKREAGKVNSSSALSAYPHSHPSHASYALEFASLPPTSRRNTLQRDDSSKESLELNFHDILRGSISSSKHETYGSRRGSHTVVEAHEYRKMSLRDVLLDSRISEDGLDGVRKVVSHDGDIDAV